MKLSQLITELQSIQRAHGDMNALIFGLDNEEADLTHVDAEWSSFHGRYALVLATGNYEPPTAEGDDPPERRLYEHGELAPRDSRDEHDKTL